MNYKLINNVLGWIVFAIALFVYTATMESSVSFWDCGEFVPGCFKLLIVHPPGAPLFLMIGRLFTLLAGSTLANVPLMVNFMSATCTAFVSLFLFWVITHIVRRLVDPNRSNDLDKIIVIMGAGFVGAMACTFLDSMWFSAVEGEVYAMSMFFTALIVWAIFKWEEVADEPHADRWLVFIAYMCGLSIGVHLLNLVCIPALVLVYFFKRMKYSRTNLIYALIISILILGVIVWGIIPYTVAIATWFEKMFVNDFKLPFNSGLYFTVLMVVVMLIAGFWYARKKNNALLHNAMLGLTFIMIGYSSFAMVVIRSNADPSIDMNNPDNPFSLLSYLNREQYGERPLAFGQYFDAKVVDYDVKGPQYWGNPSTKAYEEVGTKFSYVYEDGRQTIFPRIYSAEDPNHERRYRDVCGLSDKQKPNFSDNLKFFFSYQFGWMYWRYFMWNFVGRQNDIQGFGQDPTKGNWYSGVSFIDNRLGPQEKLPESMSRNKAMNTFYFIPFIIGLLGLFYHFQTDKKSAFTIFTLFILTGVALVVYFNSPPIEPRERDYTMVGSFYVFCIWIGMGVVALYDKLKNKVSPKLASIIALVICSIAPLLMGAQGWDDHNRHNRYVARDFASNYLNSCAPNAILFTQGDNDTYPLWYAQEVEGIRRDVRIVNLSLLAVDWYINQLRRKVNDAPEIKLSLSPDKIAGDRRNFTSFDEDPSINKNQFYEIKEIVNFIGSEDRRAKRQRQDGELVNFLPTTKLKYTVDKSALDKVGIKADSSTLSTIQWDLGRKSLVKDELMILDIIQSNYSERPIYWAVSVDNKKFLGLDKFLTLEGLAYRLVPENDTLRDVAGDMVNLEVCYDNLMNKFSFGNADKDEMYVDENMSRMFLNLRSTYARVAELYFQIGNKEKAVALLDKSMVSMPEKNIPYSYFTMSNISLYYKMKEVEKGRPYAKRLAELLFEDLRYYQSLPNRTQKAFEREIGTSGYVLQQLQNLAKETNDKELTDHIKGLESKYGKFDM